MDMQSAPNYDQGSGAALCNSGNHPLAHTHICTHDDLNKSQERYYRFRRQRQYSTYAAR